MYGTTRDRDALVRTADDYLAMLDAYYLDPEVVRRRPYIPKEMSYLVCYYTMCTSPLIDRQRAGAYYDRYRRFVESSSSQDNMLLDRHWFYNISVSYYEHWGDYANAMVYNDSLILVSRPAGMSAQLADMYARRANLYERMGRYKEAGGAYREVIAVRDSLASLQYAQRVGELEVQYGLDKVERDRALLLAQKRRNLLWFIAVILAIAIVAVVYLWRNLTRIKHLEHNLRIESQRALESDRLKRDFMGSMSHEIRTPLNAINGFSELLLTEQDPAARQAFQTEIGKSTKALTVLLENMLELSQLISTEDPLPVAQTDICLLCAERLELQRQLGDNPAVEYAYEAVEEGIEIPTNAFYLTRVLDNLLHNAAKFTAAGRITLRCRNDESRRKLQISVSDTGIGIPPEKQEWVFERFTKVDPFKPGSGIGLYLCRLIVTRLGGDIRVCPEYSGGCCIRIELPY